MARRLVRQFKTQVAPAEGRGYPVLGGGEKAFLQNPTQAGTAYTGKPSDDQGLKEHAAGTGGRLKTDTTIGSGGDNYTLGQLLYQQKLAEANQPPPLPQPSANVPQAVDPRDLGYVAPVQPPTIAPIPRTMGTPARPPDWYPETPSRIWSPDATAGTRRNTGAEDIYDTPSQLSQPQFLPPTATATNIQPPTQRPAAIPPGYGQPNVGVDITPEQFTLPPPTAYPDAEVYVPETPPVTTPIEYPTPVDMGYIETEQPYPFTPGPQVTATEQSFYNPQPVETAYAAPVNVPYVQPQEIIDTTTPLELPKPKAHYGDLRPELGLGFEDTWSTPDEVTNLIDTIIPKTLDIPQKGPQWVEDPYGLATQELIDQSGFTQTDPSIYSPAETPTIAEAPTIAYPEPIDYGPTYGKPPQEVTQPSTIVDETDDIVTIQQLPITQPPEPDMPEIPAETQNLSISYPQEDPVLAGGLPEFPRGKEDYRYEVDYKRPGRGNIDEYVGGPIETDREGAREIAEILEEGTAVTPDDTTLGVTPTVEKVEKVENLETAIPAKTITLEGEVEDDDDSGQTYTVDTEAEPNITQLPEAPIADTVIQGPMVGQPLKSFTPEIADPPAPITVKDKVDVEVDQGGKVDPALTTTGTGGRKWLHTGPSDFAETLHQFKINRGSSGPPIVTDTPAVSGPVVNRETGEITREPLTWHQFNPAGSSVSPYGKDVGTGTTGTGDTDTTGTTMGGGSLGLGEPDIKQYTDNNVFDVIGSNLYPEVKIATDGQHYFESEADLVNWAGGFMEETGVDAKPYFYDKVVDGIKTTGNHILDGSQKFLNMIQGFADFIGDPSKTGGEDATFETLKDSYNGFRRELTEFWETNPNNPWGRNMFKPGETQKYGSLQPYAILASLSNPPVAMMTAAKTLMKDIMWSAKSMFAEEANYDGNYVQDMINGTFHLVGRGLKSFGKNFKSLLGDTTPEWLSGKKTGKTSEENAWLKNLQGNLEKTSDDKLRDSWLTHAAFDSSTHKLTKAFLGEGIPVVLKNNKDKFIKAINDRKMNDFFGLMDEFNLDVSIFDQLAGVADLDPNNQAEANMIDILRAWEKQRKAYP